MGVSSLKIAAMRFLKKLLIVLLILLLAYNIWASLGKVGKNPTVDNKLPINQTVVILGLDSGKGNLIGMQPVLSAIDYASEANFNNAIYPCFTTAKEKGLFNDKTVVVLPEYIGSWLVAAEEKKSVYNETATMSAMKTMVTASIFKYGWTYLTSPTVNNKSTYASFAMKAPRMAEIYQSVFGRLAKEFHVTIVAGSIVLPDPTIDATGKLTVSKGTLYNTSVIFDNTGKALQPLVKKIFPIDEEAGFTGCGVAEQNTVFNTPAGKLGVLVCADSWYPAAYKSFSEDVKIIAVPSLGGTDDIWNAPWNGYNGFKAPADVDTTDYKKLTEGEAWQKYSMGPRAVKAGIHYGMNVFFTGQLWDQKSEGRVLVLNKDSLTVLPPVTNGRIINLWLN